MVTKMGRGQQAHLICSDCGTRLPSRGSERGRKGVGRLITASLLLASGLTAAGLMWVYDHQNPSLLDEEGINLRESRPENRRSGEKLRRWIVVPGASDR